LRSTIGKLRRAPQLLVVAMLLIVAVGSRARAEDCPSPGSEIDTDRPDTTNSSTTVPIGSFQLENGINVADWSGGTRFDGTTSRIRLGIAHCGEILVDLPDYSISPAGAGVKGFTGIAPAGKAELQGLPGGLQIAVVAGISLPTGARSNNGQSYKPYLQIPWSQDLVDDWSLHGMLTQTWIPGQLSDSLFEETLSLQRDIGERLDAFVEYVGDYSNHQGPSQVLNFGGAWRFTDLQQIDFHAGFGFTKQAPNSYIGIGYSFRLDG
jgi:hypothetical protein